MSLNARITTGRLCKEVVSRLAREEPLISHPEISSGTGPTHDTLSASKRVHDLTGADNVSRPSCRTQTRALPRKLNKRAELEFRPAHANRNFLLSCTSSYTISIKTGQIGRARMEIDKCTPKPFVSIIKWRATVALGETEKIKSVRNY
jgi:hypothetical protein